MDQHWKECHQRHVQERERNYRRHLPRHTHLHQGEKGLHSGLLIAGGLATNCTSWVVLGKHCYVSGRMSVQLDDQAPFRV